MIESNVARLGKEPAIPRQNRQISETGLYHIAFRGVDRCSLFEDPEDYEKLLALLDKVKTELALDVYAYCLMSNQVHLLIKETNRGDVATAMRKILGPYAGWFNRKHNRDGALISNRYKSQPVTTDSHLLAVVRHIHLSPVAAGATNRVETYRWSSYTSYTDQTTAASPVVTDIDLILTMFAPDRSGAIAGFKEFHSETHPVEMINTFDDTKRRSDDQVRATLASEYDGLTPDALVTLPKQRRDTTLAFLKAQGFSIRQIERTTGVPRGIVARS